MILVTIGGLLLAHNLGYPVQIWPYVARYWPVLLIAAGGYLLYGRLAGHPAPEEMPNERQ